MRGTLRTACSTLSQERADYLARNGTQMFNRILIPLTVLFAGLTTLVKAQLQPPTVIIDHLEAATKTYIGSPSLVVLWTGEYLASHDIFGPESTKDTTVIFASLDRGLTWVKRGTVKGAFWSTLFTKASSLYMIGTDKEYGNIVIRRSEDDGVTWSTARDPFQGLLMEGGKYHMAPTPVLNYNGRFWKAVENADGLGAWPAQFRPIMLSCPVDADLLNAKNWTASNMLSRDPKWQDGKFNGWLEGNAVFTSEGKMVNLLRVDNPSNEEFAARIEIGADGKKAEFNSETGFLRFPGGCKKFTVRYDLGSKLYWTLSNYVPKSMQVGKPNQTRNTLALFSSADLMTWKYHGNLLQNPDATTHAYQYVDWLIDGKDIIAISRTADNDATGGAHDFHDANFITFHRFKNYKKMKGVDVWP